MARRAPRFRNFIGHRELLAPVLRELRGAKARGEAFPHVLLTGPSGVGKTMLSEALAEEMGTRLVRVMGYANRETLLKRVHSLRAGDFLLIDEAHALKPAEQELLFAAIDRGRAPPPTTSKERKRSKSAGSTPATKAKARKRRLQPFTLVLATDRPSYLVNALQKRIPTRLHLTPYALKEMKEIVEFIATQEKVLLSPQAARRVAEASHGLPRRAKHLLVQLRFYTPQARPKISITDVSRFLRAHGIDRDGLGRKEQRYLRFLNAIGKASLDTLAQFLGTDRDDVLRQVEPILVRKNLVVISPSGRQLTEKGRRRVERAMRRKKKAVAKKVRGEDE